MSVTVGAQSISSAWPQGLLERGSEQAAIEALLDSAQRGVGGLVICESPPGCGKTVLLEAAIAAAAGRGTMALLGRGHELEREFAFGICRQLFERVVAEASASERRRLFAGSAGLAAPLLDGGSTDVGAAALIHGMQWLATNLAGDDGLLLVIDDAQWADVASVRFLVYLAQRLAELPIGLLVARRREGDMAAELRSLRGHPEARVLSLAPLSAGAVEMMVRAALGAAPASFCRACRESTGGNPFLLRLLLADLVDRGIRPSAASAAEVRGLAPTSALRAVVARIARLSAAAEPIARAVAVLDADATAGRAARLCGVQQAAATTAISELTESDLFAPDSPLRFSHPMIQSALLADISPRRRSQLHLQAARLLAAEGVEVGHVASHLLKVGVGDGDLWCGEVLGAAADEALARGAPESAVEFLRRAIEEPELAARPDFRRRLGEARFMAGDRTAPADLKLAVERLGSPWERGRAALALGRAEYARGGIADAITAFDRGLAAIPDPHSELALQLQSERFQAASLIPDACEEAIAAVAPVVARSLSDEASPARRSLLAAAALGGTFAGHPHEQLLPLAERAYDDGRMLSEEGPAANSLYSVTMVFLVAGEYERDLEILDEVLAASREVGSVTSFATASFCQGTALYRRGRLSESIAAFDAAIDARRYGWAQFLPFAIGARAEAVLESEGPGPARDSLEGFGKSAEWEVEDANMIALHRVRGRLRLLDGDPAGALEEFLAWSRMMPAPNPAIHNAWRSHAALAYERLGDHGEAVRLASEELALAQRFGAAPAIGLAQRTLGSVQRGDAGIATLSDAVATLAGSQARLELCRARVELGAALRRAGSRGRARDELRGALALAEILGAATLAERARSELQMAGARPRRQALRGVASLTPGEERVVREAADGYSNREIAERLFVTVKTVEWHLRNAYRKLEIGSREQLSRALSEHGAE